MTIKTSGPISLLDIFNEYGGSGPTSIGNYYRGGIRVNGAVVASPYAFITPPKGSASGVQLPTGGMIQFSEFYGTTANVYPAAGTVLQANVCQGTSLGNIVADGNGGSNFQVTQYNSPSCGYVAPIAANSVDGYSYAQSSQITTSSMSVVMTIQPTGGTGTYTYQWSFVNDVGTQYTLRNADSASCFVDHRLPKLSTGYESIGLNCLITSAGQQLLVQGNVATFEWDAPS